MSNTAFVIVGFGLMLMAGLTAYVWRKRARERWRRPGGIIMVLAPIFVQAAFAIVAALPDVVPSLNAMSPLSQITYFEAAWLLSLFWAPFWICGAACGYMLRSMMERPLNL